MAGSFRSVNKAVIIGNVGKAPEFREYGEGQELCRFSVATSESWKNKQSGEYEESTQWHNVVVFNKHLVGIAKKILTKGALVYVEGMIKTRSYEKDGVKHYVTEITLGNFDGELKCLQYGEDEETSQRADTMSDDDADPFKDDIPF